jgi:hypothetical protein
VYYANDAALSSPPWTVHGLGNEPNPSDDPELWHYNRTWCYNMRPLWVYPSMFYSNAQ